MSTSVNDLLDAQIAAKQAAFCALSNLVWDTPETNYLEYESAAAHKALLEKRGLLGADRPGRRRRTASADQRRRRR